MSNMSYCRFENTLGDLQDCRDALDNMQEHRHDVARLKEVKSEFDMKTACFEEIKDCVYTDAESTKAAYRDDLEDEIDDLCGEMDDLSEDISALSQYEYPAARNLLELCQEIADTFDEDDLIEEIQL